VVLVPALGSLPAQQLTEPRAGYGAMQCAVRGATACGLRGRSSKWQQRGCTKAGVEGALALSLRYIWARVGKTLPCWCSRSFREQAGAAFSLRDRQLQAVAPSGPVGGAAAAWKVTADDELMNEDELLTEEDLLRPVKAPGADDCEVRLHPVTQQSLA